MGLEIVYKDVGELNYFPGNPRVKTQRVLKSLARSIREFGFVNPVIVWENSKDYSYPENCIIGGHRRVDALNWLIQKEKTVPIQVPCIFIRIDGVERAKALNIALNKIGEEFEVEALKNWLTEIRVEGLDIEVTGFEEIEVERMFEEGVVIPPENMVHLIIIECENEKEQSELLEEFLGRGLRCRSVIG